MRENDETELMAVEKAWAQAFVKNDPEAIGRYMADDWTVISPDGNVIDKPTFLGLIKSGMLTHEGMEFGEMGVRVYGNTAVVTSRATSRGRFRGEPFTEMERSTDVFVKQEGEWRSVVTHLTRIGTRPKE